jgi:Ca-activated chloride channel family protein
MFRFANPEYLYALLLIPALMIFFWYSRLQRRKAMAKFGHYGILSVLMPDASKARPILKYLLLLLALTIIIIVIARPQFGSQ